MKKTVTVLLGLWGVFTVVVAGALMATHDLPLPLGVALQGTPTTQWKRAHILSGSCGCSRKVADALLERGPRSDVLEEVVLVEDQKALGQRLRAAGFAVRDEAVENLVRDYGVQAAPLVVIYRPDGSVAYQGAYAARRSQPPEDETFLARARAGQAVEPYPLFGCAVSKDLQERTDPLRLKY